MSDAKVMALWAAATVIIVAIVPCILEVVK